MASVEWVGMDAAQALFRGLPAEIDKGYVRHIQQSEARPLGQAAKSRAGAYGRIGARAGSTVRVENTGDGAQIRGGGAGLGGVLFGGAEFGGRRARRTYARRSSRGRAHVVHRRRTTMMFLPHLGTTGYFYWPAARRQLRGITERMARLTEQIVNARV